MIRRSLFVVAAVAALLLGTIPMVLAAEELPPGGTYVDDDLLAEEGYIEAVTAAGILRGCNPPENDEVCPHDPLTRAQLATVFVRVFDIPAGEASRFSDTAGSVHERAIDAMAAAGITTGCNPPANDLFCPTRPVTRGQFAKFLAIVLDLDIASTLETDFFDDDDTSVFEPYINALAIAGLTKGCLDGTGYCPDVPLKRRQLAVFMARVLDLEPNVPPERPPPPYPEVGDGKRIIYSNSEQQVWLIDENNELVDTYLVSGRDGIPLNGTYEVYSKSVNAWAPYGGITMKHMVRFVRPGTFGNQWAYGFHSIPRYPNGDPMQTEDELGYFRSGGCVRQADYKAEALFAWAELGTTVHAIP